jgi:predicted dehydrogenase
VDACVIGLGAVGAQYDLAPSFAESVMTHAKAIHMSRDFRLAGAVDPNEGARSAVSSAYSCETAESVDEFANEMNGGLVVVAVPDELHLEVVEKVLQVSRPAFVLCEKPMGATSEQARAIIDACKAADVILRVNYMRRSDPGAQEVRRRLVGNEFRTPVTGRLTFSGDLRHVGCHFIDLMRFWFGSVSVASLAVQVPDYPRPICRLFFRGGEVFVVPSGSNESAQNRIELVCTNGRLDYARSGMEITWTPMADAAAGALHSYEPISNEMNVYQRLVLREILALCAGDSAQLADGEDALAVHEIIDEINLVTGR